MNKDDDNIHIYDLGTHDDMKRHLWKTKRIFFPFSIPWKRFLALLFIQSFVSLIFGALIATAATLTAGMIGWAALPGFNLAMIATCVSFAHWTIFLLTDDVQKDLHIDYVKSFLHSQQISPEEFNKIMEDKLKKK